MGCQARGNVCCVPTKSLLQVNTSGEDSKFGLAPEACLEVAKHIAEECHSLKYEDLDDVSLQACKAFHKCRKEKGLSHI